jgi:hypothetical protein
MSDPLGRYESPQAECESLYQECQALLLKIRLKRLNTKLLRAAKHSLELILTYKNKPYRENA